MSHSFDAERVNIVFSLCLPTSTPDRSPKSQNVIHFHIIFQRDCGRAVDIQTTRASILMFRFGKD